MNNKDNFIDELNIKNLCIGTNIKYDISRRNVYNDEKKLESTKYLTKARDVFYVIQQHKELPMNILLKLK